MATFVHEADPGLLTCPYNPVHKVRASRFLIHIGKCSRSPGSPRLAQCPFSPSHRVPHSELGQHQAECPEGRQVIREFAERTSLAAELKANPDKRGPRPLAGVSIHGKPEEQWNDGSDTYSPSVLLKCKGAQI